MDHIDPERIVRAEPESTNVNQDDASPRRDVCVIGAGPSGLAALKVLRDHPLFQQRIWNVVAYEARESIGGIWLPSNSTDDTGKEVPATPLYDALTTNLPHPVMAYTSLSFPPSTPLFPPASTVLKYLETYAEMFDLIQHIQFRTRVVDASWDASRGKWRVRVRRVGSEEEDEEEYFDLLVVANGHYAKPRYPSTPGVQQWLDAGKASHSVYYRNPSHPSALATAQTVLVIGGGPSGLDISSELRVSAHKRVVHSVSNGANEDSEDGRMRRRGRVKAFLDVESGEVEFEDGTREKGIEYCVLATGYQHDLPFLHEPELHVGFPPAEPPPLPSGLYNSTYHVFPLAKHIFPIVSTIPVGKMAFLGVPWRVVPFPLVEAQMQAVVSVLESPERLDVMREAVDIVSRYEDIRASVLKQQQPSLPASALPVAIGKVWHMLEEEKQFDYRDGLGEFAGVHERVPGWVREMYGAKGVLREEWRSLERAGEAGSWIRGVGEGGEGGWVELMRRLL
ncbi:FAD/NAD-P-binding domain-containing protein, partial [Cristinia sonorae]